MLYPPYKILNNSHITCTFKSSHFMWGYMYEPINIVRIIVDLPLVGADFPWSNNQVQPCLSRIDHFLYLICWGEHFSQAQQSALPKPASDHVLLLLRYEDRASGLMPFLFELMWLELEGFKDKV